MITLSRSIPIACVLAATVGLVAAPALGQAGGDSKGPRQGRFEAMDKNADGKVSREEFLAGGPSADMLSRLDANGDGVITREEAQAASAQKGRGGKAMERMFDAIDADKDGR
ncbi:MAG: hypothetical protein JNK11_17690, partial [Alphaproteobacteria bacterium]|nr:hypothetical protein [Alphaproteobacteria bacterium]